MIQSKRVYDKREPHVASELEGLRSEDHAWQAARNVKLRLTLRITGRILVEPASKPFGFRKGQRLASEAEALHDLAALAGAAG